MEFTEFGSQSHFALFVTGSGKKSVSLIDEMFSSSWFSKIELAILLPYSSGCRPFQDFSNLLLVFAT